MDQRIQELVEELRSTGYHGREAWLPSIDREMGTSIAAIRQLEVCASQMVSPWFDAAMDEQELWSFLRSSFLPRLLSLEEIVESSYGVPKAPADTGDTSVPNTWAAIRRQIRALSGTDEHRDYGGVVVTFLVSVMLLRQLIEAPRVRTTAGDRFVCESTNVSREFLSECFAKARLHPFQVVEGASLHHLAQRIQPAGTASLLPSANALPPRVTQTP